MKNIFIVAAIALASFSSAPAHAVNPVEGALLLGLPCAGGAVLGLGVEAIVTRGRSAAQGVPGMTIGCATGIAGAVAIVANSAEAAPSQEQLNAASEQESEEQ